MKLFIYLATNTNADAFSRLGKVMITRTSISNELLNFKEYQNYTSVTTVVNCNVKEEDGDLFEAPIEFTYVLCVSQDLEMDKRIALMFRRKFGFVEILKSQHPKLHEVLYLTIYFLPSNKSKILAENWIRRPLQHVQKCIQNMHRDRC